MHACLNIHLKRSSWELPAHNHSNSKCDTFSGDANYFLGYDIF